MSCDCNLNSSQRRLTGLAARLARPIGLAAGACSGWLGTVPKVLVISPNPDPVGGS